MKARRILPVSLLVIFVLALFVYRRLPLEIGIPRLSLVGVGVLTALLGTGLGSVQPNWWIGIATPWTLSDREVWDQTHRAGEFAFVVAGLLVVILAGLASPLVSGSLAVLSLLGLATGLALYSYFLWRRLHRS
jgi:uncharacterized membrane protein